MTDDVRARIRRGAALLDKKRPGWRDRIAIGELDLASGCHCVLGQEFENEARRMGLTGFCAGLTELQSKTRWPKKFYSENASDYGFADTEDFRYPTLTAEWIAYLKGDWE